jgi:flagellar P-ring protein FlgI
MDYKNMRQAICKFLIVIFFMHSCQSVEGQNVKNAPLKPAAVVGRSDGSVASRIKDIADFHGVRDNLLVGYGLVVGLNGTGDKLNSAIFTKESLISMLERLGINARDRSLNSKNVAGVIVTATLPPFSRQGARIDVNISTLGDATNLQGGTLVATPLRGADNEVYALAQGSLIVSGFSAKGQAASVTRGVPTTARLSNGAIIEREIAFNLNDQKTLQILLRKPDFTTAERVAHVINQHLRMGAASVTDPGTIVVRPQGRFQNNLVHLMTTIERLSVVPDLKAKVVIDETSGVTVITSDVRISPVAVSHGSITVQINETQEVSQPNALSNGQTVVVPRTNITVEESGGKMAIVKSGPTLKTLVHALNKLGLNPRDLITILQAIKASGALQGDIEVIG